jgi:hypothetical protein
MYLAGCGDGVPPGDGTVVTFDTVCDKGNEGKRVALEGFLDFPDRFNAKAATVVMKLKAAPTQTSRTIGARVKLNAGNNALAAPPDKYNENDLRAISHDGKPAGYRTRLKITGTMTYTDSLETRAFTCHLADTRIELAGAISSM